VAAPPEGKYSINLVRFDAELTPHLLATVPTSDFDRMLDDLSVSSTGLVLAPHIDGAGLYDRDGALLEVHPVGRMDDWYPKGGLSPDGRWMALTGPDRQVRILDREAGTETLAGPFDQVLRIEVSNGGTTWIYGLGPEQQWGIYRARAGALDRVSDNVHGQVSPSGERVLEVREGLATLRAVGEDEPLATAQLPWLIGKHGRSQFWDEDHVVVRMGGHTPLLELDLREL